MEKYPKLKTLYIESNEKVEKFYESYQFAIVKLTYASLLLPPMLITTVNYFIYDLKDESYFLGIPVMYELFK